MAEVIDASGEFNHGYTYSGHPVACAVALENLRIMRGREHRRHACATRPRRTWRQSGAALADHPLVGEARSIGLMGGAGDDADKASRRQFAAEAGTVGLICRELCFANGLVMRHVGDRMIISPPLVITEDEIDTAGRTGLDRAGPDPCET